MTKNYEEQSLCYSCMNYYSIYTRVMSNTDDKWFREGCILNINMERTPPSPSNFTCLNILDNITRCTHYDCMDEMTKEKRKSATKFN